jgi:hypothetical protein
MTRILSNSPHYLIYSSGELALESFNFLLNQLPGYKNELLGGMTILISVLKHQ